MKENWKLFIAKTTAKSKSHTAGSRYWNKIDKTLLVLLVTLGVATTFLALLPNIPSPAVASVSAVFTLIACVLAFLRPAERRQIHVRASREFQSHMLRMVRCKSYFEYDELWQDFNKNVFEEPYLHRKHCFPADTSDIQWAMTPELAREIINKKEELRRQSKQFVNRSVGTTTDMINIEPNCYFNTNLQRPVNYFASGMNRAVTNNNNEHHNAYPVTVDGSRYGNHNAMVTNGGMNHAFVSNSGAQTDEAFEVVCEHSTQGIAIWGEGGKQKKKQTFQQLKRSQTTTN